MPWPWQRKAEEARRKADEEARKALEAEARREMERLQAKASSGAPDTGHSTTAGVSPPKRD